MNIFDAMNVGEWTRSEQAFIDYVFAHARDLDKMSITGMAKSSYVSPSTIYRVIDKLELSGTKEFKLRLLKDYPDYAREESHVDVNYPFAPYETIGNIVGRLSGLYQATIANTYNMMDNDDLLKAVQMLDKAERIVMMPTIGNYFFAESFQQHMLEIGKNVEVENHIHYQHWKAVALTKKDVVIVISYANRTPFLARTVSLAKERGAKIILISSVETTELTKLADVNLYIASLEDPEEKIASFSSRISLEYILDCLYACYFNRDYDRNLTFKTKYYIDP